VRFLIALLALIAAPIATAADLPQPKRIDGILRFLDQQCDIRDAVENDQQYRHVRNTQRDRLNKVQDARFAALEVRSDIAGLSDAQRIAVFNAQEEVNAFLLHADPDRPICQRRKPVGSHRPIVECHTKRERLAATDATRFKRMTPRACRGPDCTGN
jgi:hypothetical protein